MSDQEQTEVEDADFEDFMFKYKHADRLKAEWLERVQIKLEADGTVTMTGLKYRDFSSLMTSASLYRYDEDKKPCNSEQEYLAAKEDRKNGVPEKWSGRLECLRDNARDDILWRLEQRAILEAIEKKTSVALTAHNREYSKWESWYFKWISNPRWKMIRLGLAIKRFWKKNGYNPD